MPVKGIKRVQMNTRKVLGNITGAVTEKVLYRSHDRRFQFRGANHPDSHLHTHQQPVRELKPEPGGMIGRVGYTASYAAWVNAAGGTLKGKPGPDGSGNYWDPDASRIFCAKALSATAQRD
jgi:hypothetical protein